MEYYNNLNTYTELNHNNYYEEPKTQDELELEELQSKLLQDYEEFKKNN